MVSGFADTRNYPIYAPFEDISYGCGKLYMKSVVKSVNSNTTPGLNFLFIKGISRDFLRNLLFGILSEGHYPKKDV